MDSKDVFTSSKQLEDISAVYMEAVYGKSAGQELAKREKDDDAFGAPKKKMVVTNADKKGNTPAYQNYKKGDKRYVAADHMKEAIGEGDPQDDAVAQMSGAGGDPQDDAVKQVVRAEKKAAKKKKVKESLNQSEINSVMSVIAEKQKDTPDQVKAVIAYDKARKGTEAVSYTHLTLPTILLV